MTPDEILHAIKAVDWASLSPGLEDPTEIPDYLSGLITRVDKYRGGAWGALRELLVNEWQWSEAGAAAAPLLVEMVRLPDHPARPWALMLLADLLTSEHLVRMTDGVDLAWEENRKLYVEGPAQRILDAVRGAGDDLLRGLDDPEPAVRSASAFVLAFLSELASRAYEPVARAARAERNPWLQASLFLSLAALARYRKTPLEAAELEGWLAVDSPILRAFAWLGSLYSEPVAPRPKRGADVMRELSAAELTPARRQLLVDLFRAGDPPIQLFPWSRAHIDRVVTWELTDRGERARLFVAGALAEVAAEEGPLMSRLANEALRLCFASGESRETLWESPEAMGEERRAVVATLSRRNYLDITFQVFGLPAGPWERLRWLGVEPPMVLDRSIRLSDGREIPLWQELSALDQPRREALLTALSAHLEGADRLEALALVLRADHALSAGFRIDDLYAMIRELGPAAAVRAREILPVLIAHDLANVRGTGVGMALVWALARELPPGATLPPEYDVVLSFLPTPVIRELLPRIPPERREALVLAYVRLCREQPNRTYSVREMLGVLDLAATPAVLEETLGLADDAVQEAVDDGDEDVQTEAEELREEARSRAAGLRAAG